MKHITHLCSTLLFAIVSFVFSSCQVFALTLDAVGGDCSSIGVWNPAILTCTLTADITDNSITIDSDGIILDGAGHTITGTATTTGITVSIRQNISIRNLTFSNFSQAINLANTKNTVVENSIFLGNITGIFAAGAIDGFISGNVYRNNIFTDNRTAISLAATRGDIVEGNTITGTLSSDTGILLSANNSIPNIIRNNVIQGPGSIGVLGSDSDFNEFTGNTVKNFTTGFSFTFCSIGHIFRENTIEGNTLGAFFAGSSGTFTRNNFKNNTRDIQNGFTSCGNGIETLSQPIPEGGNYWSAYDTPGEGCLDTNSDGMCDAPFAAATSTSNATNLIVTFFDDFPWTRENGWNLPTTMPPTLFGLGQFKSDSATPIPVLGITTENTVTIKGVATSPTNRQVRLEVEIRLGTAPFTGADDGGIVRSPFGISGAEARVKKINLADGVYHWRARAADDLGAVSDWTELSGGGNIFEVKTVPLYTQVQSQFPPRLPKDEWSLEQNGDIKTLEQRAEVEHQFSASAEFERQTNQTIITTQTESGKTKQTSPGLVVLGLETKTGELILKF